MRKWFLSLFLETSLSKFEEFPNEIRIHPFYRIHLVSQFLRGHFSLDCLLKSHLFFLSTYTTVGWYTSN